MPLKVLAKRLTAQQFAKVLERFYNAYGSEIILHAYGWTRPPTTMLANEKAWTFSYEGLEVGWGSCHFNTRDAEDVEAVLVVGVWPEHQRHGYQQSIFDWMAARAKKLGAERASFTVGRSNEAQASRWLRATSSGQGKWKLGGMSWYPGPGYYYFVQLFGEPDTTVPPPKQTLAELAAELPEPGAAAESAKPEPPTGLYL